HPSFCDTPFHPLNGIPFTSLVKTNHFIHLDVQFKNKHAMMLPVKHKKSPFGIKVISPLYLRGDETRRSSRFMLIDSKESPFRRSLPFFSTVSGGPNGGRRVPEHVYSIPFPDRFPDKQKAPESGVHQYLLQQTSRRPLHIPTVFPSLNSR